MNKLLILSICIVISFQLFGQDWQIVNTRAISKANPVSYSDNIEMAGKKVAGIIYYKVDSTGVLTLEREIIYPQLRKYIGENESRWRVYRAYLKETWKEKVEPLIYINNYHWTPGSVAKITIDGSLNIQHNPSPSGIGLKRTFLPSVNERMFIEKWKLTNHSDTLAELIIGNISIVKNAYGNYGQYTYGVRTDSEENIQLAANESTTIDIQYFAQMDGDKPMESTKQLGKREEFLDEIHSKLILKTPNEELNTLFAFSKVRAAESIFDSKMGIVHSPGGGRYYAGVWANDQAEYSGPC